MPQLLRILAGGAFVIGCVLAAGSLIAPRTALPRSIRLTIGGALFSLCVFILLLCRAGYLPIYLAAGALLMLTAARRRPPTTEPLPRMGWFFRIVLAACGLMYFVFALAPEIQPDAASYHLRLVSEYVRLHTFSNRLTFFDLIPQGMEMLFVPAFAIGAHSAAKLIHFAFLLATIPLIRHLSRELGLPDRTGCAAAALFFLAPVCGVTGTSAYTDSGLVCCCLAVFYLLIRWDRERLASFLLAAAIVAGFACTIKQTFGWISIVALVFVVVRTRKLLPAAAFAGAAMLLVLPWAGRAWFLSGNPFAPFLNTVFPNQVSTPAIEKALFQTFSLFRPSFPWGTAPVDYTVRGGNEGLLGPAFLFLPLALLALRTRRGRCLLAVSLALAVPFAANTGTRFLMPAMATAAIALASVLPAPAVVALVALQAIGSAPPVIDLYEKDLYEKHAEWRLREIPVAAAFRVEPEQAYLDRSIKDFGVTRLIAGNTPAGARVFSFVALPDAYIPRELSVYWYSAAAQRAADALMLALSSYGSPALAASCIWHPREYRSVRITADSEFRLLEARLNNGGSGVNSWRAYRPGESISLPVSPASTAIDFLVWPGTSASASVEAQEEGGGWRRIDAAALVSRVPIDLRRDATASLRRAGFHFILARVAENAYAPLGADMLRNASEWGMEPIAPYRDYWLFYIKPELW